MFLQVQLFAVLVTCAYSNPLDLDYMTLEHIDRYFDVDSFEKVPEYEIVSPLAFSLHGRRRRDIESVDEIKEVKVDAFGESFHMRLAENRNLLAAGLQIDRYNADGSIDKIPIENPRCYYHGKLISHDKSTVAVSTCKGLTGIIATEKHNVYIRPLSDDHAEDYRRRRRDVDNPHVIYRRNATEEMTAEGSTGSFCGLDPEYEFAHDLHDMMEIMEQQEAVAQENNNSTSDGVDMTNEDDDTDGEGVEGDEEDGVGDEEQGDEEEEVEDDENDENTEDVDDDDDEDDDDDDDDNDEDTDDDNENENTDDDEDDIDNDDDDSDDNDDEDDSNENNTEEVADDDDDDDNTEEVDDDDDTTRDRGRKHREEGESRRKRATANTLYLELRVTIDLDMVNRHGANAFAYTMTLINIVAARYMEPSLGRKVVIHVVKFDQLATDNHRENIGGGQQAALTVTDDGKATLDQWSSFQRATNDRQDANGRVVHWDNAILISRKDLRSGNSRSLLGIAWLSGTCHPQLQASYNQDIGLAAARVMAHELGHSNGMEHDDAQFNGCPTNTHVMSGSASSGGSSFLWSSCSRNFFANFLLRWNKQCLNNQPSTATSTGPGAADALDRPGQLYDANTQCQLLSLSPPGETFSQACGRDVTPNAGICGNLHCRNAQNGRCYAIAPAAEGTACGSGKWCDSGECVNRPPPTNTHRWNVSPGQCSVTCGTGVRSQIITCVTSSNAITSDNNCDASSRPTPSTQQCVNSPCPVSGVWVQVSSGTCSITCGQGVIQVQVTCRPFQGSNQILPDTQCSQPKPASQVQCNLGNCPPSNTGLWAFGSFSACSASCGPGTKTRTVECRLATDTSQSVPESQCQGSKPVTSIACNEGQCIIGVWITSTFSSCSVTCGTGTKTRQVTCRLSTNTQQLLSESYCQRRKPPTQETCNLAQCVSDYFWAVSSTDFSPCTATCGGGTRTSAVWCLRQATNGQQDDSFCASQPKPQGVTENCNTGACHQSAYWGTTGYSQCSVTCGQGTQQRSAFCLVINIVVQESECDGIPKPATQRSCSNGDCPVDNNTPPDQGEECAGLYTHPATNVDRIWPHNEEHICREGIVAPVGQTIKLTFSECNIRCAEGTGRGYVLDGSRVLNFCCYDETFSWTSSSNFIQIEHLTTRAGHGYRVNIEFVGQPEVNGCNRIYTSNSGTISSIDYPSTYPYSVSCQLYIISPPGTKVDFEFTDLALYARPTPVWLRPSCARDDDDNIEITNVDTGSGIRYCGTHESLSGVRKPELDNRVLIHFRSTAQLYPPFTTETSKRLSSRGFQIEYSVVDA